MYNTPDSFRIQSGQDLDLNADACSYNVPLYDLKNSLLNFLSIKHSEDLIEAQILILKDFSDPKFI